MAITAARLIVQFSSMGVSAVTGDVNRVDSRLGKAQRSAATAGRAMTTGVTLPAVGFLTSMLHSAGTFEQSMNKVRALTGDAGEGVDRLRGQSLDLAKTTRYTASEIADGMGFMAMAGMDVNQIYGGTPAVLNLAAAGNMDLARSADIATNIMTGFGKPVEELPNMIDVMVAAFTNSNTSLEQMGDAFKYVAPVAASAGLDFNEVTAAIGLLGNAGIQSSMAGTVLRGAITRLLNPTKQAQGAMDRLGVTATDAEGNMLPLSDILGQLHDDNVDWEAAMSTAGPALESLTQQADDLGIPLENADGSTRDFTDVLADLEAAGVDTSDMMDALGGDASIVSDIMTLFGLRAGPGMLALLAQGEGALDDFTAMLNDSGGTAERVASTMMEGLFGALNMLRAAWEGLMISLADSGALDMVTGWVMKLVEWLGRASELSPRVQAMILAFIALAAAIGPVLIAISLMIPAVTGLVAAIGFLVSPVGLVVVALATLVAGLIYAYTHSETFRNVVHQAASFVGSAFSLMWSIVQPILSMLGDMAVNVGLMLLSAFQAFMGSGVVQAIGSALQGLWAAMQNLWSSISTGNPLVIALVGALLLVLSPIGLVGAAIVGFVAALVTAYTQSETFRNIVTSVFQAIGTIVGMVATGLGVVLLGAIHLVTAAFTTAASVISVATTVFNGIGAVVMAVIGWFTNLSSVVSGAGIVWSSLSGLISGVMSAIGGAVQSGWATVQSVTSAVISFIVGIVSAGWQGLVGIVTGVMAGISGAVSGGWSMIQSVVSGAMGIIQGVVSGGWSMIQGIVSGAVAMISGVVSSTWSAISSTVSSITSGMVGTVSGLWSNLQGTVSGIVSGIQGTVTSIWSNISSTVSGLVSAMVSAVIGFFSNLLSSVTSFLSNLLSTATSRFSSLRSQATSLMSSMVSSILGFLSNLLSGAISTISSIVSSITTGFNNARQGAVTAIQNLASDVLGALRGLVGSATGVAREIGSAIIGGLTGAISDGFGSVKSTLGGLTDMIPDWKGPEERDRKLLEPAGEMIIEGLVRSMTSGAGDVRALLQSLTGDIGTGTLAGLATSPAFGGAGAASWSGRGNAGAAAGGLHIENLTLDLKSVQELVEAAAFVQDMNRARSIVRGARVRS